MFFEKCKIKVYNRNKNAASVKPLAEFQNYLWCANIAVINVQVKDENILEYTFRMKTVFILPTVTGLIDFQGMKWHKYPEYS